MIPRSFDVEDGSSSLSMRVKVTFAILDSTCDTRNSMILVLEGLMIHTAPLKDSFEILVHFGYFGVKLIQRE